MNKKNELHKQKISFLSGFQYNLSLGDVLWNPLAAKAELESRFSFDGPSVEKLLSYTAQLTKVNLLKMSMSFCLFFKFYLYPEGILLCYWSLDLWGNYKVVKYPGFIPIKRYLASAEIPVHEDTDRSSCVHEWIYASLKSQLCMVLSLLSNPVENSEDCSTKLLNQILDVSLPGLACLVAFFVWFADKECLSLLCVN